MRGITADFWDSDRSNVIAAKQKDYNTINANYLNLCYEETRNFASLDLAFYFEEVTGRDEFALG
ncbi:hypothetical protein IQ259_17810 [Fortiea sp. LEGE XX443]|uniref:hypothetical protein n=1 Tax=Fortiea sp. LEGE XX443 TaxID=1828611 RepID=UPI00188118AF|nr:hypothetical protein [Fortiea sp. LEGE XX443]MBE9006872.1 hypothetical protein [Fortiea sp. LEGE XX443]